MSKPDFSEAMLQMVVNFELINAASKKVMPIIPSLIQEKNAVMTLSLNVILE